MSSPAEGAKDLLITAGVAALVESGSAWTIKVGRIIEVPDKLLAVFDTGAAQNANPAWLLDYPTIQCIIRGPKEGYSSGWSKGLEVKDVLLGLDPTTVNGDSWDAVTCMGDLIPLKYDDLNRPLFSINFRIILEPAASGLTNRAAL